MRTSPVPAHLRRWIERRLLSAEPSCDSFELRYLNDGSPLGTISAPQGGKIEQVIKALYDELTETSIEHAQTSDGMHRFSIEAFGPRPERRSLGAFSFALSTHGAGSAPVLGEGESGTLPKAFEALDKVMGNNAAIDAPQTSRIQDISTLLQSLQGVTGSAVPAATLKVGLDFAQGLARLVCEVIPTTMRIQNETITQLSGHIETMRGRDIETHEMVSRVMLANDLRRMEVKAARKKAKRADERMTRLMNIGEALLPDVIEQFTGETPVIELLETLNDQQLAALNQFLTPKQRGLMKHVVLRAQRRADKIKNGGKRKPKKPATQTKEARE